MMQQLSDCGINPFAVQLFWESWSCHETTPCHPITFPFRDAVITIQKVSDFKHSADGRAELLAALKVIAEYTGEGGPNTPWRDIVSSLGEIARAALAKNTGKDAA